VPIQGNVASGVGNADCLFDDFRPDAVAPDDGNARC